MKNRLLTSVIAATILSTPIGSQASTENPEIYIKIQKGRFSPSDIQIGADTKVKLIIENFDDTPEEFESYDLNREVLINPKVKSLFISAL